METTTAIPTPRIFVPTCRIAYLPPGTTVYDGTAPIGTYLRGTVVPTPEHEDSSAGQTWVLWDLASTPTSEGTDTLLLPEPLDDDAHCCCDDQDCDAC